MADHRPDPTAPAAILRDRLGLSIAAFAREAGLTRATVYALERGGACRPPTWRKLWARWPAEIRAAELRSDHFVFGTIDAA